MAKGESAAPRRMAPNPIDCPGEDDRCPYCNGEACNICGPGLSTRVILGQAERCEHDTAERHEACAADPESASPGANMNLRAIQAGVAEWQQQFRPDHADPRLKAAKLCEEAGEVVGACIKMAEGRRTRQDVLDEIGDVGIALCGLAALLDADLLDAITVRWAEVQQRRYFREVPDA